MADPVEELLKIASEAVEFKNVVAERAAELTHLSVTDRTGAESVSAVLGLYAQALKDATGTLVAVNKLQLSARRVAIELADLRMVAEAVRRAVFDPRAALTDHQADVVLEITAEELGRLGA